MSGIEMDQSSNRSLHAFVSYSRQDEAWAKILVDVLQRAGIAYWIDYESIPLEASDWQKQIKDAISNSFVLLLIATANSASSPTIAAEIGAARVSHVPVIFLWIEGENWVESVSMDQFRSQHLDCRGVFFEPAMSRLITSLQNLLILPNDETSLLTTYTDERYSAFLMLSPVSVLILDIRSSTMPQSFWTGSKQPLLSYTGDVNLSFNPIVEWKSISSYSDLLRALRNPEYEIIHLLGDINRNGLFLNDGQTEHEVEIALPELSRLFTLLCLSEMSRLRLLIVSCGLHTNHLGTIVAHTPYTIIQEAKYPSPAPAIFIEEFYHSYLRCRSVKRAYDEAIMQLDTRHLLYDIDTTLVKRERYNANGKLLLEVAIDGLPDTMTLELTDVKNRLTQLGIGRDEVLRTLSTKIRAHSAIFASPREDAILPIGSVLFGIFSWNASAGYIRCKDISRFETNVDSNHWEAWCRLLFAYNRLSAEPYRSVSHPNDPAFKSSLQQTLHRFQRKFRDIRQSIDLLSRFQLSEVRYSFILGTTSLENAEDALEEDDSKTAVSSLETALTCLHDIVRAAMPRTHP